MAHVKALFPMLERLDKAERAYVRKQLGGEALQFFEAATRKKNLSEGQLRAIFGELSDGQFATLRTRTLDQVADYLGEYQGRMVPANQLRSLVGTCSSFMRGGQPSDAQRVLKKALRFVLEHEEYSDLKSLAALNLKLRDLLSGNKRAVANWQSVDALWSEVNSKSKELEEAERLLESALALKLGGMEDRLARTHSLLAQIPPVNLSHHNKYNLILARATWVCHAFTAEYGKCIFLLDWAIDWSRVTERLWHDLDTFEAVQAAYFMRALLWVNAGNHDNGLALLDEFEAKCISYKIPPSLGFCDLKRLAQVKRLIQGSDDHKVVVGLRQMLKEIGQPATIGKRLHTMILHAIDYLLMHNHLSEAKRWLPLLARSKKEIVRPAKVVPAYLLEMTLHYAAGDFTALDNAIRRLEYYAKDRNIDQAFVNNVMTGFKSLASTHISPRIGLEKFILALAEIEGDEEARTYFNYFDLKSHLSRLMAQNP